MDWTTGVQFPAGEMMGFFLFTTALSISVLGPTQPPNPMGNGGTFPGVKRPKREADHSLPLSVKSLNAWSYTSTPPIRLRVVTGTTLLHNKLTPWK
jgi:hypothetical protein